MNIDIYETKSLHAIRRIVMADDIPQYLIPFECDEFPSINLNKLMDDNLTIYGMRYNNELVGIAFFLKDELNEVRVDEAFLKKVRGKVAKELAIKTLNEYIMTNKPRALKGQILNNNKRALMFAKWMGFEVIDKDNRFYYVKRTIGH